MFPNYRWMRIYQEQRADYDCDDDDVDDDDVDDDAASLTFSVWQIRSERNFERRVKGYLGVPL